MASPWVAAPPQYSPFLSGFQHLLVFLTHTNTSSFGGLTLAGNTFPVLPLYRSGGSLVIDTSFSGGLTPAGNTSPVFLFPLSGGCSVINTSSSGGLTLADNISSLFPLHLSGGSPVIDTNFRGPHPGWQHLPNIPHSSQCWKPSN